MHACRSTDLLSLSAYLEDLCFGRLMHLELCGLLQPNYWGARIMDSPQPNIGGPRIDVPEYSTLLQRHRRRLRQKQQQLLQPQMTDLWGVSCQTTTRICTSSMHCSVDTLDSESPVPTEWPSCSMLQKPQHSKYRKPWSTPRHLWRQKQTFVEFLWKSIRLL